MPRNDWEKLNRRDRGRKAVQDGSAYKVSGALPKKNRSTKKKPPKQLCRCCGKQRRDVGRDNICLRCYRVFRHKVHQIADARNQ
jgi:hypothetical protein